MTIEKVYCKSLPAFERVMVNHKIFILISLILVTLFATGCSKDNPGSSENNPVYSESSGDAYKISLMVSDEEISDGGSIRVLAYVTDPYGNPVPDEDNVVKFACSQSEVKFDDEKCDVRNGIAETTAHWEDQSDSDNTDPPINATITASYKATVSTVQVTLISKAF